MSGPRTAGGSAAPAPSRCATAAGSGVLEVLVAAFLASLVVVAAVTLLHAHARLARDLQGTLAASSSAAWAADVAARDLALAGADPLRRGVEALRAAGPGRVEVESDSDGDGAVDASSAERIALAWAAGSGGRILRRLGGQSMAMASPVDESGFRLRYLDRAGAEVAAGELDAAERARVCRVHVEVAVAEGPGGAASQLAWSTALRMRLWAR